MSPTPLSSAAPHSCPLSSSCCKHLQVLMGCRLLALPPRCAFTYALQSIFPIIRGTPTSSVKSALIRRPRLAVVERQGSPSFSRRQLQPSSELGFQAQFCGLPRPTVKIGRDFFSCGSSPLSPLKMIEISFLEGRPYAFQKKCPSPVQ